MDRDDVHHRRSSVAAVRIVARDVGASFPGRPLFQNVSATIEQGSLTAIVGPSGSGKSTLLFILGGLLHPNSGEIFAERAATRLSPGDVVTWIPQTACMLGARTVADNVRIGAHAAGWSEWETATRCADLLDMVGLSGHAERLARVLSGGEVQRLALARALATERPFILADEPTAQLDAANTQRVVSLLRAAAEGGRSVVVATHDPTVAAACHQQIDLA